MELILLIAYLWGAVTIFAVLGIGTHYLAKDEKEQEVSLPNIMVWSVIWPVILPLVGIMIIFDKGE